MIMNLKSHHITFVPMVPDLCLDRDMIQKVLDE